MDPDPSLLVGIVLCLLVLACISAIDAAFTSVSWRRVRSMLADRAQSSRALARLLDEPYRFKATIIILNTSATIAAAAQVLHLTAALNAWYQFGALTLLMFAILTMSAALPKALVMRDPPAYVQHFAGAVGVLAWGLSPLITVVKLLTRPFTLVIGVPMRTPLVVDEELRRLVNEVEEEGLIGHEDAELLEGVVWFNDALVGEVMVPRVNMVALEAETPLAEAIDTIIDCGHSRIPVYRETIDNVVGILYAKDLLLLLHDSFAPPVGTTVRLVDVLRPAYFVAETMKIAALHKELQQSKIHLAMVADEYGGTAGLVTVEDLVEQIVGEIQDEYDTEAPTIQQIGPGELLVAAHAYLTDINELTGLELASDDVDRIGALVYEKLKLGRVPRERDTISVEGATITVLKVKGMRPQRLRIRLHTPRPQMAAQEERASQPDDTMLQGLLLSEVPKPDEPPLATFLDYRVQPEPFTLTPADEHDVLLPLSEYQTLPYQPNAQRRTG